MITFIFCPYLRDLFTSGFENPVNFLWFFMIFSTTSYISLIFFKKVKTYFKFDLFLRFFKFFTRNFGILLNLIKVKLLLFVSFLTDTNKDLTNFIIALHVTLRDKIKTYKWRPLFKKTSYFGFFRSNRSKWFK